MPYDLEPNAETEASAREPEARTRARVRRLSLAALVAALCVRS